MSFTDITRGLSTLSNGVQTAVSTIGGVAATASNIAGNLGNLSRATSVGGALNSLNNVVGGVSRLGGVLNSITNPSALGSAMRSMNLPFGGELAGAARAMAAFGGGGSDWRVKLGVPGPFLGSPVLFPLLMSDCSLVFPYTPTISITGSAGYEEQSVTHQNYQFVFYNSGKSEQIQIVAPFNVEDQEQGLYWLAAVHFLRSATKMFTGNDPNAGNPPVICRLNGYGDYVFPNVPVIVRSFSVDMSQDVNYIQAGGSHVPVKSTLNITLQPIYSRTAAKNFSLTTFVNGGYIGEGYV